MSDNLHDMGRRLKAAREAAGWGDASAAARAMGVAVQTYLAHENGSRGFRHKVKNYAKFFKVRWEWLLEEQGARTDREADYTDDAVWRRLGPAEKAAVRDFMHFIDNQRRPKK